MKTINNIKEQTCKFEISMIQKEMNNIAIEVKYNEELNVVKVFYGHADSRCFGCFIITNNDIQVGKLNVKDRMMFDQSEIYNRVIITMEWEMRQVSEVKDLVNNMNKNHYSVVV